MGKECRAYKRPRDTGSLSRPRNSGLLALMLGYLAIGRQTRAGGEEGKVVAIGGNVSVLPPWRSGLNQRAWTGLATGKPMQIKLVAPGKQILPLSLPRATAHKLSQMLV